MAALLSDVDIVRLIAEVKLLDKDYRSNIQVKPKRGHSERELQVLGEDGSTFLLVLRQNSINLFDFSVILSYCIPGTNQVFRLRRYNGKSHEHTNTIEGYTFYDFHIHMATERYQTSGLREDTYAETTDRYADLHGAIQCMLNDCAFDVPESPQKELF